MTRLGFLGGIRYKYCVFSFCSNIIEINEHSALQYFFMAHFYIYIYIYIYRNSIGLKLFLMMH